MSSFLRPMVSKTAHVLCLASITLCGVFSPRVLAAAAQTPVVDVHVHLINVSLLSYPWADQPANRRIARTWTIKDLDVASSSAILRPSTFVFCEVNAAPQDWNAEARYVQSLADAQHHAPASQPRVGGIVAHIALERGKQATAATLDSLMSDVPLLRGVRQGDAAGEDAPGFLLREDFIAGVSELGARNLHYELLLTQQSWGDAVELVRRLPNVTFVVNHMASPDITSGGVGSPSWQAWTSNITALASSPNVWMMISGAPQEASHGAYGNWTRSEVEPYVKFAITAFGFSRCVYAGNWFWINCEYSHRLAARESPEVAATDELLPVLLLAVFGTYEEWASALSTIVGSMSPSASDMHNFYVSNAQRVYRIDE